MTEADGPYESLRDPYGIAFWPQFKRRDGCRTPMPWSDADAQAGFSRGVPWLPVPEEHRVRAVEQQQADPRSVLNGFRTFMRWRQAQPALRWGDIELIETDEPVLAFIRRFEGKALLVMFNLAATLVELALPAVSGKLTAIEGHGLQAGLVRGETLHSPGHGAWFARLD